MQRAKPKATSHAKKRNAKPKRELQKMWIATYAETYPAFGKECHNCGEKSHFAKCCFSKKRVQLVEKKSDSEDPFFVDAIEGKKNASNDEWIA